MHTWHVPLRQSKILKGIYQLQTQELQNQIFVKNKTYTSLKEANATFYEINPYQL